ncbi:uncharacterized protein C3orf38 homolog [Denticeps clupeoides]|uniref:uncharacterized protein C3orf38 homolog n=1 Tax=Denticeps clupeoides TaxID=299321 RepID=UPI0010A5678A|nr:uncharacterized protein C3orf38 homolog [Denticeps clupeoides]
MSRLSSAEVKGCKQILSLLAAEDVLALTDTVTGRAITVTSIQEAVAAIVAYSNNAEEFLKRKKVHRDVIFKYLANEGVVTPANAEKHQLIKKTLELWSSGESESVKVEGDGLSDLEALGQQFCGWFFHVLNSQNPAFSQTPEEWGANHFWEDARLSLACNTGTENKEEFQGSVLVSQRLQALCVEEKLLFCPNTGSQGLRCIASRHGLVAVAVAGTIHREHACLGIFEQVFGIIRAPLNKNSWKIKFIHLKIRGQNTLSGQEELTTPALTYSTSDLQLLCS